VESPPKREKPKAGKMPENAARTPSRVHALLARFLSRADFHCTATKMVLWNEEIVLQGSGRLVRSNLQLVVLDDKIPM
jgi:hypothetical protein